MLNPTKQAQADPRELSFEWLPELRNVPPVPARTRPDTQGRAAPFGCVLGVSYQGPL